jgi:nicotinate-nucleotide--dimethylbenzimidazole phosphoribosyltransferase
MSDSPRAVLDHILASITPASAAQALAARERLTARLGPDLGVVGALAARLAGARHAPRPRVERSAIVICAADQGVADPGVDFGANHPTRVAAEQIAGGGAAVNAIARSAGARVVVLDCGIRGGASDAVLAFRQGDGSADITAGPAMTPIDAVRALQTGIAVLFSLAEEGDGLDVLALGQVSPGAQPVSTALVTALTDAPLADAGVDREAVEQALSANPVDPRRPLEVLAALGGYDIAVMAGLVLGAASINVPIVLDDHGTSAAALVAARLAPSVSGYVLAAHAGSIPAHRRALAALGTVPPFELGLAQGEGAGAALLLPFLASAAELLRDSWVAP